MDNLAVSFFSLVKNNNGLFKSEKQANFLKSKLTNDQYGVNHGANMLTVFTCDNEGVLLVEKVRTVKGERVWETVFNRKDPSVAQNLADKEKAKLEKAKQKRIKKALEHIDYLKAQKESYIKSESSKVLFNKSVIENSNIVGVEVDKSLLFTGIRYNLNAIYQAQIIRLDSIIKKLILENTSDLPMEKLYRLRDLKETTQEKLNKYCHG